jgi:hypothetical protein
VNKPVSFPLNIEKSWTVDVDNPHPANKTHRREKSHSVYKVAGYESVEEYYSTTNIRSERFSSELESFKPAS